MPCVAKKYSQGCHAAVARWARDNSANFWVDLSRAAAAHGPFKRGRSALALKKLTYFLPRVLACVQGISESHPLAMVDAGAGIHGLSPEWALNATRLHTDDSDALWLLSGFGSNVTVHAFEINEEKVGELRLAAESRPATRAAAGRLVVHNQGLGNRIKQAHITRCGSANTFSLDDAPTSTSKTDGRCRGRSVDVTTLDAWSYSYHLFPFYGEI